MAVQLTFWERHGLTIAVIALFVLAWAYNQTWGGDDDSSGSHPAERRAEELCGDMSEPARSDCAVAVFDDYQG